jgi:flagellar hook assembly protein FlgD
LPDERVFSLYQNAPNPGFGRTAIKFSLNKQTKVAIKIYNIGGQLVRTLIDKNMKPGVKSETWNGVDGNGRPVPAGIYFYEMEAMGLKQTGKLVMIR